MAGFAITETIYDPDEIIPDHAHVQAKFVILVKGGFSEECRGNLWSCSGKAIYYRPSNIRHSNRFHRSGATCLNISLEQRWMDRIFENGASIDGPSELAKQFGAFWAERLYDEFHYQDEVSSLSIESILLEIVACSTRQQKKQLKTIPAWLARANEFIREEYMFTLSLERIAETVGVHQVHLARSFHKFFGITIGEYVRQLRIVKACELITTTDKGLAQIAVDIGFYDQAHFSKYFRRITGFTPKDYRTFFKSAK